MEIIRIVSLKRFVRLNEGVISSSQFQTDRLSILELLNDLHAVLKQQEADCNLLAYNIENLEKKMTSERSILELLEYANTNYIFIRILDLIEERQSPVLKSTFMQLISTLSISSLPIGEILENDKFIERFIRIFNRIEYFTKLLTICSNCLEDNPEFYTPILISLIPLTDDLNCQFESLYVLSVHYFEGFTLQVIEVMRQCLTNYSLCGPRTTTFMLLALLELVNKLGIEVIIDLEISYEVLAQLLQKTKSFADIKQLFLGVYMRYGDGGDFDFFFEQCNDEQQNELRLAQNEVDFEE